MFQLFSLKYVYEDEFKYNVYKYLANSQLNREDADYEAIDEIGYEKNHETEEFIKESKKIFIDINFFHHFHDYFKHIGFLFVFFLNYCYNFIVIVFFCSVWYCFCVFIFLYCI